MITDDLGLSKTDRDKLEKILLDFDEQWNPAALPDAFADLILEPDEFCRVALLELIKIDLHRHWEQGKPRQVDSYSSNLESVGIGPQIPAQLILAEFLARHASGKAPVAREYQNRFPDQFDEFKKLIETEKVRRTGLEQVQASIGTDAGKSFTETKPEGDGDQRTLPETFGRYKILRRLGAGAMGAVYLAHDTQLDRQVALKTPSFGSVATDELIQRFYREARSAANLRHPNICTVFDVGEIDGRHYITMAYIEGRPLSDYIGGSKPLEQKAVAGIVRKLALALADAHQAGVIHRDLKPDNIMVDQSRQPQVMDFGLARRENELQSRMTQTGAILGTPAYMSPEQVTGQIDEIGPQADIYSLGIILYELLTGNLPFDGSVAAVIGQILTQEPTAPSQLRENTDRSLEAICLRMIAKEKSDRYGTMKEVAADLAEYVKGSQPKAAVGALHGDAVDPFDVLPLAEQVADPLAASTTHAPRAVPKRANAFCTTKSGRYAIIGAAVVGLMLVALSVTLIFRTPYGTLTITTDDPDIVVEVDGRQITIRDDSPIRFTDGTHQLSLRIGETILPTGRSIPFEIVGRQGEYRLSANYGETELRGNQFRIDKGTNTALTITLIPVESDRIVSKKEESVKNEFNKQNIPPVSTLGSASVPRLPSAAIEITEVRRFEGHTGPIKALAYSPHGRHILSVGVAERNQPGCILWDVATGKQVHIFENRRDG